MDDLRDDQRQLADEIGRGFAERPRLDQLLHFAVARCRELLDAESVAVLLVDAEKEELYCPHAAQQDPAVAARVGGRRLPTGRGIVGAALFGGRSVRVDDAPADPRFVEAMDQPTSQTPRALLCTPLPSPGGAIGVIEAVNSLGSAIFDDQDQALLEVLAESLAVAVRGATRAEQESRTPAPQSEVETQGREAPPPDRDTVFRREGDYWTTVFEGRVARLKDAKGLHYIAYLLRHPGQEFHVSQLITAIGDAGADLSTNSRTEPADWDARATEALHERGLGDAGPMLDAKAKAAYKQRLDDLREELEEAERFNDPGRAERAREEMEFIGNQLAGAVGLGGRDRAAVSDAERARLAVTKRIKAALVKIRDANPALAQHLGAAITTGYFCSYAPKADAPASWSF